MNTTTITEQSNLDIYGAVNLIGNLNMSNNNISNIDYFNSTLINVTNIIFIQSSLLGLVMLIIFFDSGFLPIVNCTKFSIIFKSKKTQTQCLRQNN